MYRRPGRRTWYAALDRDRQHISLHTEDEEQARINFAELIDRAATQGSAPKKGQLGAVFVECATRARVNHSQQYAYNISIRLAHVAKWLEAQTPPVLACDKVTLGLVEKFKSDEQKRGVTDRTINRTLDVWKKAMRLAIDEGYAVRRVMDAFRKFKEPDVEPHQRGLSLDDIDTFLKCVEDERYYFLFRTVAGSGIRDDEARHLADQCVRDTAIVITPLPPGLCTCHPRGWTTKNFRNRTIPVSAETAAAARAYVAIKHAMNLDQKKVYNELQRARIAAGHDWQWSLHELRRAWGSHLLAAGLKLSDISRWYGHRDIKTTMRYLRVVEHDMPDPSTLPL